MKQAVKAVAYLDLLAFSHRVRENTKEALEIFTNYQTILESKIRDGKTHPPDSYQNENLKKLASERLIDSFNYFLPFSDSIFIVGEDPDLFLKQIGHFVLACFIFDSADTTRTIFRGGISWGEVHGIDLIAIIEKTPREIKNLVGKAVVEAVYLESKVKGPRIIFDKTFYESLKKENTGPYIREIEDKYEILWPAFSFIPENGVSELSKFDELFIPAFKLWKTFADTEYSEHYFNFLELIFISTLKLFESINELKDCHKKLTDKISEYELNSEAKKLFGKYF
ncbi:MAG: hypothetical protein NT166_22295 [Candidatus Aminicenantes bacterium]|nr:hypothetical protein [Candidatus Aminicenantes bacterium]